MNKTLTFALVIALTTAAGALAIATQTGGPRNVRPQGPCDIYAAANDPCVAAHSTTRALYRVLQRAALSGSVK